MVVRAFCAEGDYFGLELLGDTCLNQKIDLRAYVRITTTSTR